jgi:tRNA modification GTPase
MSGRTIFAILTPPGSAAIATVALAGPEAWDIVRRLFRTEYPLPSDPATDQFRFGRFGGLPGDEVVVAAVRGAPCPRVEIHCHGGPEVVRMIGEELSAAGANRVSPDLCSDELPPCAAAARSELGRAPTHRTAAILLDQLNGALDQDFAIIREALDANEVHRARELAATLLRRAPVGLHLTRPWRVVVAGAPNVGKSSLVNALAGYQRSAVTPSPGTTRDVVVTSIAIDGWPVDLIDTAGDRNAVDTLEREGIVRGRSAVAEANLTLWVLDGSAADQWPNVASGAVVVINKSDLPPAWDVAAVAGAICVSALTGVGLAALCSEIGRRLASDPPPAGAAVPFAPALVDGLERVARAIAAHDLDAAGAALAAAIPLLPAEPE